MKPKRPEANFDYSTSKESADSNKKELDVLDLEIEQLRKKLIEASKIPGPDRHTGKSPVLEISEQITVLAQQKRQLENKIRMALSAHNEGKESLLHYEPPNKLIN